ncbi:MAG: hypothetical protein LCH89_00405 [Proteobacteria bacterium]|nr:hypothetical protein [Pseudomonadota bacterium]
MPSIDVPAAHLKALARFTVPKDIRSSYRGVWVERSRVYRSGFTLAASNGFALAVLHYAEGGRELGPTPYMIDPKPPKPARREVQPRFTQKLVRVRWSEPANAQGGLPWRDVFPAQITGEPAQYAPHSLNLFGRLAAAVANQRLGNPAIPCIHYNGPNHPGIVTFPALDSDEAAPEFVGVISPVHSWPAEGTHAGPYMPAVWAA